MKRIFVSAVLTVGLFANAASAATCADRSQVVKQLEAKFGETLYANSISRSNKVLEVFASPGAKTWSIMVFLPERGLSCLAATGKGQSELNVALKSS